MIPQIALVSLLFSAVEPVEKPNEKPKQLVIWYGSGKSREAAEASLRGLEKARPALKVAATLPAGYPKIAESKDYVGLKPGYWIVVLGVCDTLPDGLVETFQAIHPHAYARQVTGSLQTACPSLVQKLSASDAKVRKKKLILYAATTESESTEASGSGSDADDDLSNSIFVLLRDDSTGEVLDIVSLDGTWRRNLGRRDISGEKISEGCQAMIEAKDGALVVLGKCDSDSDKCDSDNRIVGSWEDTNRLTISGQAIAKKNRHKVTISRPCSEPGSGSDSDGD